MQQIVCRLWLRPRPHCGAYSAPPDPLAVFRGLIPKKRGEGSRGEGEMSGGERMGEEGQA